MVESLKKNSKRGIILSQNNRTWNHGDPIKISATSDASFADDISSRRSTYGYFVEVMDSVITWQSKLTNHVALSTTEAEYISISEAAP